MGRPLHKMDDGKIRELIKMYPTMTMSELGRKFGIHHTTVLYYVKKIRQSGIPMEKLNEFENHSAAQRAIDRVARELRGEEE